VEVQQWLAIAKKVFFEGKFGCFVDVFLTLKNRIF